ncbi:hypothetical protein EV643_101163 [Kribbella sp. VKM Ac-2527]|uniref:Uncharacterized protein n=1 Tax=Kribbella caucasensis TaxID=2512215 RepID=A0A4V3CB34_9ACTN|nr:hypothetical protein EV643_101163 [Kribbella sp. VKM Ac-2527]
MFGKSQNEQRAWRLMRADASAACLRSVPGYNHAYELIGRLSPSHGGPPA